MKQFGILLFALLGVALLTMGVRCQKDFPLPTPKYEYVAQLTLTPYKKIYAINDTIWMVFKTADKTLFDQLSGKRVSTDTTFLRSSFYLQKRYPIGNTTEFFSDVVVDSVSDSSFKTLYTIYNILKFQTGCGKNHYFFRVGFVPKKPGIYSINPGGDIVRCPDKLSMAMSTFKFTFDLVDCNKDVWLSIPPASRGGETGLTDVRIDKKELFVFKVE